MVQGSIDATAKLIEMGSGVNGTGGISSLISGNNSISEFGKELKAYAPNLVDFAKTVSEAGVTSGSVFGAAEATKTLGKMTEELPKTDGWINAVIGKNSLSSLGDELSAYGQPLADFAQAVNGKVDENMVKGAADATITLAKMTKEIPAEGGLVQRITGTNSLATFGDELRPYGKDLAKFEATESLTKMAQGIPLEGGLVERITGSNSLSTFGDEIRDYGSSLSKFATRVEGVSLEQVQGAVDATIELTKMTNDIPYDSISKIIGGKASLSAFGEELKDFGRPFAKFAELATTVDPGIDVKAKEIATATTDLMNGLPIISARMDFEMLGEQLRSFGKDFGKFYEYISDVDSAKFTEIVGGLNAIASISDDISDINGKGLVQLASGIGDISTEGISGFVSSFVNSAGDVRDSAASMVTGAIDGLSSMSTNLFNVVSSIGNGMINIFKQSVPYQMFKSITESQVIAPISDAMNGKKSQMASDIRIFCTTILTAFRTGLNQRDFYQISSYCGQGLLQGLLAYIPQLQNAATRIADIVNNAIRSRLKINSPSEETFDDGAYVIMGMVNGMEAYADRLKATTENIAEEDMLAPIKDAIVSVNDDGTINTDTQPVIRPVLDLSEVENGYKQINSLFDDQYRLDMQTRMGKMETSNAINPAQIDQLEDAIRSINNDDVINEMETLRNDISNLKDAMTNLQVVLNTGTLVGEIVEPIDKALGNKTLINSRGRY